MITDMGPPPVFGLATTIDIQRMVDERFGADSSEAARFREFNGAVCDLAEAALRASATLSHAYHMRLEGQLAEHAHADYLALDSALSRLGVPV